MSRLLPVATRVLLLALALAGPIVAFSAGSPGAFAQTDVPDAPTAVAVYSIESQKLEVRWSSSDSSTTSFKVQWKSASEEFDSTRQLTSDPATSIQTEQTTSAGKRYKVTLTGLTDGTEYTVRVIAANANGDSDPSATATGTPASRPGEAQQFLENEVVKIFEGSFPWLRETWDYMTTQSVSVAFVPQLDEQGVFGLRCADEGPTRRNLRQCSVSSVKVAMHDPSPIYVITHELAHVYTLANGVTSTPGPLGIAFLYFYDLRTARGTRPPQSCAPRELYADALTALTLGDDSLSGRTYWRSCPLTPDSVSDEALAVVRSASAGAMPAWFEDTYNDTVGDLDLERVWADTTAMWSVADRAAGVFQLRDTFGGYCEDYFATRSAFRDGVTRNPWRDGGCQPDAPSDVSVAAVGDGKLTVSWQEPDDDGGSPIRSYYVKWKSGTQEYDLVRNAVVFDLTDLRWTIDGLTNDVSHSIQVVPNNNNSGFGEAAEVTATPTATDSTPPLLLSARIEQTVVRLNWREALDESSEPGTTAFTVNVGGSTRAIDGISISGSTVTLMLESAVTASDAVTVDYLEPSGSTATPLKDAAGNNAVSFSSQLVRNDTTEVAITSKPGSDMTSIWGNGLDMEDTIEVTVTFSESVLVSGVPELALLIGGSTRRAYFSSGSGTASLVFRYTLTESETGTTGVRVPDGAVQTGSGLVRYASTKLLAPANVQHPNSPPEFPSSEDGARSVDENTPTNRNIGAPIQATDTDNDGRTYSISGSDADFFDVVASSGQLRTKGVLNHESRSTYAFAMSVTDGRDVNHNSDSTIDDTISVTVTVTDLDEGADITFTTGSGVNANDNALSVDENHSGTLATFNANDPESQAGLTYTWSLGGRDASAFGITSAGALSFANTPDYERPVDSGGSNAYDITVSALDSDGKTGSIKISVAVEPVNEPPTVTGERAPSLEEEGMLLVGAYQATDPENATVAWQPLGGTDSDKFEFTASNGRLSFKTAPDYEDAHDSGGDNVYDVTLSASGGGQTTRFVVAVSVTNKEEFGSLGLSSPQPQAEADYIATLNDPDAVVSTTWTWERSTSRTSGWAAVSGAADTVTTSAYTPLAGDVGYYLRATASYEDGHGPNRNLMAVSSNTVRAKPAVNNPPEFADETTTRSVAENAGANATVGARVTASDADSGDTVRYELDPASDLFTIDAASGQIRVKRAGSLDHELAPSHTVTVKASDSSNTSDTIEVTITVTDVNEAPEAEDDHATVNEDDSVTIDVLANDGDPEDDDLTVRLSWRPRNGSATVDPVSNEIAYTPKADYNGSDSLSYVIRDEGGLTDTGEVALMVRSVNDPPRFSGGPLQRRVARTAQGGDNVGTPVTATDIDGDRLTYGVSGADASSFEIDEDTGQITVAAGVIFDPLVQSEYWVRVEARDEDFEWTEVAVTITVVERVQPPITIGIGGGGGGPSGPSPSEADFEWTVKQDIDELDSGHDTPSGMWSDGATLWLADNPDGAGDAIYAYDLDSEQRVPEREFKLDERNRAPRGVWSDGTTLWVADSGQDKLFAHDLAADERLPDSDIELADRNADPRGIWSDEETMWVLDGAKDALFAYDLATGDPLAEYALDATNRDPHGIWSDGVAIWVSDHGAKRLFAYRIEAGEDGENVLKRNRDEEFPNTVLSRASNNSPRGIWSDGDVMYVADASDDKVYTYNMPDAIDARLASLTLSGVDIGEFLPGREEYEGVVGEGATETTVEAEAMQRRTSVGVKPDDADGDETNGYQVALEGVAEIAVTVTSADGSRERTYRVAFKPTVTELALSPTWTSFAWPGADGTTVADALRESEIWDRVLVLYEWDEAAQTWKGFFPGLEDVPELNTLTTLRQGSTYWVGVTEPLTWTLETRAPDDR